jgi:hypothetical protein
MPYLQGENVCICGLAEVLSLQIKIKIGFAIRKSTQYQFCGRFENLTIHLSPQICGFAICGPPTFAEE